jgi:hypothetical protein
LHGRVAKHGEPVKRKDSGIGADFAQFRGAFTPNFAAMFDFDGSGTVDLLDFNQFRSRFQTQV